MFNFLKRLFAKKRKFVSRKEIKQMYKNMSKNDLIRIIDKLVHENAELKMKRKGYITTTPAYIPKAIEKAASGFIPVQTAPPIKTLP